MPWACRRASTCTAISSAPAGAETVLATPRPSCVRWSSRCWPPGWAASRSSVSRPEKKKKSHSGKKVNLQQPWRKKTPHKSKGLVNCLELQQQKNPRSIPPTVQLLSLVESLPSPVFKVMWHSRSVLAVPRLLARLIRLLHQAIWWRASKKPRVKLKCPFQAYCDSELLLFSLFWPEGSRTNFCPAVNHHQIKGKLLYT